MWKLLVPCCSLTACVEPPVDDGGGVDTAGLTDDTSTDDSVAEEDSGEPFGGPAELSGTVRVALTWEDEGGNVTEYSWAEATGGEFVFGAIFVAIYSTDEETGVNTYWDTYTVPLPSTEGDAWELTIEQPETTGPLYLYAELDYWNDGILGTDEPVGPWPEALAFEPLEVRTDMELVIATAWGTYYDAVYGGGGGGGGGSSVAVTLSGTGDITQDVAGGRCSSLLYYSDGSGPYDWAHYYPTDNGDGTALGAWTMPTWGDMTGRMLGACDGNSNYLIDPADPWGTLVEGGNDDNPLSIGSEDISDLVVQIPFEGVRASVTPFATLSGSAHSEDGFDSFPSGSTVYIAALRTMPSAEFSASSLSNAYDYVTFTGGELTGSDLAYTLMVPTNRMMYVWAFADTDGDGNLNEVGEPLGNPGSNGSVTVGSSSQSGLDMNVQGFE